MRTSRGQGLAVEAVRADHPDYSPPSERLPAASLAKVLTSACQALTSQGLPHLSHDDLRHLFATQCIESGVDIPTVSRWLGHKDGGALAMKTYGRLRQTHSQQQAATADFLPKPKLQPTAASSSSS
ncbi:MAG: tyrosine-type recombinase/integrase [Limisphaerales bacterium]